jgi:hypothetical protein
VRGSCSLEKSTTKHTQAPGSDLIYCLFYSERFGRQGKIEGGNRDKAMESGGKPRMKDEGGRMKEENNRQERKDKGDKDEGDTEPSLNPKQNGWLRRSSGFCPGRVR